MISFPTNLMPADITITPLAGPLPDWVETPEVFDGVPALSGRLSAIYGEVFELLRELQSLLDVCGGIADGDDDRYDELTRVVGLDAAASASRLLSCLMNDWDGNPEPLRIIANNLNSL